MAKPKKSTKASTGRGSPEAIEKRRVARHLNSILLAGPSATSKLDGRTEKRRKRLIKELVDGRGKPIDVVSAVNELLEIGETLASLKKQGVKPRKTPLGSDVLDAVKKAQSAYNFKPDAWKMLGVALDKKAEEPAKRGRPKKKR